MSISLSIAVTTQPPKEESLPQLAERLQAREAGALEKLIERTQGACSRLAVSILKDPELSRDALQDAYFVVFQRIGQLRDCNAIKSWLFRIVTHCCHDILRRRGQEFQAEIEVAEVVPDLAEGVGRQETIRATFAQLPEIDRTTLALREVASLSYEEMAEVLQVPLGTVRSRLAKARQRFIDKFKGVQHD